MQQLQKKINLLTKQKVCCDSETIKNLLFIVTNKNTNDRLL